MLREREGEGRKESEADKAVYPFVSQPLNISHEGRDQPLFNGEELDSNFDQNVM